MIAEIRALTALFGGQGLVDRNPTGKEDLHRWTYRQLPPDTPEVLPH